MFRQIIISRQFQVIGAMVEVSLYPANLLTQAEGWTLLEQKHVGSYSKSHGLTNETLVDELVMLGVSDDDITKLIDDTIIAIEAKRAANRTLH